MSARYTALVAALLLSAAAPATAAACTWQGATGTWYTMASWSCGAVPTPDDDRTQLALTAPTSGRVTIEALDALGRRVAVLFDGVAEAGQPVAVAFEAGALPAGLYVVRAVGGGLALSRTVTLTR